MTRDLPVLITFAVAEERRYFPEPIVLDQIAADLSCEFLLTGIGRRNAERTFRDGLTVLSPQLVISSGFAGGLNPELKTGTVVFEADEEACLSPALRAAGARPARFHCAEHIIAKSSAKLELWRSTGADAVEMESAIIRRLCRERNIPAATVRIISDSANEDLPLDFNRLMTPDLRLNYVKLAWALAKSPVTVARLWEFRRTINHCGKELARVLSQTIGASWPPRPLRLSG